VLSAANSRLQEVRRGVPDAGGLVIAGNQELARQYAALLASVTGQEPTLVLSDDAGSSARIAEFAAGTSPWMVAVRMVSEGVDVPRLSVGVYATTAATPLYFAQAVGRFVRARRKGETASIFVPSVPAVLALAGDLEAERDHVIGMPVQDEADLLARAERTESTPDALEEYRALGSEASFDRVVYEGGEYGGYAGVDDDELDFLGIPGLLEPDQVADLLRASRTKRPRAKDQAATTDALFEKRSELRRELHALVAAWHHRTGEPHGVTHHRLRRACGGPPAAQATSAQLTERIDLLRQWALRASS
jgi:superfamily II DNA/RNA helicase